MKFLDQAKIHVRGGNGGNGCVAFRREKYVELGGPAGGNGGRGGDVVAVAVEALNTLIDFRYQQHLRAKHGRGGEGSNRTGAGGADRIIQLPVGTQVFEADPDLPRQHEDTLIADLVEPGQRVVLARGGTGGYGNSHYKSSVNRAPRRADPGQEGEERDLWLRLKLLADAGLVGLPNAGKSTFLAHVSRARPRISGYPFTTLHPQLGVVYVEGDEFVLADLPGLIEGAHEGAGLGDRFLGHIERCGVLLHLVDGTGADTAGAYRAVREELDAYGHGLTEKAEILALNKIDALTPAVLAERVASLEAEAGCRVMAISGAAGTGIEAALHILFGHVRAARAGRLAAAAPAAVAEGWHP